MKTFNILFSFFLLLSFSIFSGYAQCPASAKINEFHYDNAGGDANEFVEIALPVGSDPTQVQIDLINGNGGSSYDVYTLSAADFVSSDGTFDYYVWYPGSIQNGGPDGLAVSCTDGTLFQFLSYEGAITGVGAPVDGVTSTDVGVEETGTTTDAQSIMCDGNGGYLTDCTADAGAANDLTSCGAPPTVTGCTDMAACNFDMAAEEDDGSCYNIGDSCNDGDGSTINDVYIDCATCQGEGTGVVNCGVPAWEAVSVTDNSQADVWTAITNGWSMNGFCGGGCAEQIDQWLVYGPLDMTNTTVLNLIFDAAENFSNTDLNIYFTTDYSSACPGTTTWTLAGTVTDAGNIDIDLSGATGTTVYIAIEYSDDGADGYSDWDLINFQLLGDVCPTVGTPVVSDCNTDAGCTDANACNYNMDATIDDGSCYNIGDSCDDGNTMTTGDVYTDCATCEGTLVMTGDCPDSAKINEFHYDNGGTDANEFVEITIPVGSDPTQIQIDLINGNGGSSYDAYILSMADFVSSDGTFDYYVWYPGSMQNGDPDGIAVSCLGATLYQFISYEGVITGVGAPVDGATSTDIGVAEGGDTTDTQSIMCDGTGNYLTNCTADPGMANDLTTCGSLAGCTDSNACNYSPSATIDDGSCFTIGDACDDANANTSGDVYTDCDTCAGTCDLGNAGDTCDDGDPNTENDTVTANCACAGTPIMGGECPASAKINEFHYDNGGTDANEFVEIALPAGSDPTQVQIDLINGNNGSSYDAYVLTSADLGSSDGTFDYYVWYPGSMQNGDPDGITVSCLDGSLYQFISYEGVITGVGAPVDGATSIDVGVAEGGDTTDAQSIMCDGTGTFLPNCVADPGMANNLTTCMEDVAGCTDPNACNFDMTATTDDGSCFSVGDACDDGDPTTSGDVWGDCATCVGSDVPVPGCTDVDACNYDAAATMDNGTCFSTGDTCDDGDPDTNNDVYVDCDTCAGMTPVSCPASAKINEFHYDNVGSDVNEFVEITLPYGSDPTGVQVDLYNGNNGAVYGTLVLSNAEYVTTDYYFDYYVWNISLQNGNDGIAVSCTDGTQYQFITYEGAFMATDGPFAGVMGTDIGVEEPSDAPDTSSLMCDGTGTYLANCTADAGFTNDLATCVEDPTDCSLSSTTCEACPAGFTNESIDLTTGLSFNDGLEFCADFGCGNPIMPPPNYDASTNTGTWTLPAGVVNAFAVGGVNDLTLPDAINGGCLTADLNIISGTTPFIIEFRIENGTGAPGNGGQALTFDVTVDGTGTCSMGGDFSDGAPVNGFAFAPGTLYSVVIGVVDFTGNPVDADIVVEISNVALNVCAAEGCDPPVGTTCDDGDANTTNDVIQSDCSCAGNPPGGCTDVNATNYDPAVATDDGSCLYLCDEDNLLDVSTNTGFDGGSGLSYGAPTGMGLLTGANDDFGGFIWDVNTDGLTIDQICMFNTFTVTGDATGFPVNLEFRIQNDCGGFPCPWIDFNVVINGPGTYTLGGLLNTGNNTGFDPSLGNSQIVAAITNFSGTPLGADVDVVFSDLCISDGNCIVTETCDDPCAPNFGEEGTCQPYDMTCNDDCTAGPFGGTWDPATCGCINETTPINGCTDPAFCEYDPAANCDDGSCANSNVDPGICNTDCTIGEVEVWDPIQCLCVADPLIIPGCNDPTACNYVSTANCNDGSCNFGNTACTDPCNEPDQDDGCDITTDSFDQTTCTVTNTPNCPAGTTFNAGTCNCDADPIPGCVDMDACNFDMNANTDDGTCIYADAATISTTSSTTICVDDGIDEPIDVTIDNAGQGDNGAWVITDENAIILALPAAPPFILDGAGVGTCLIWYVNFSDVGFTPQVGDNASDLVTASGCAALSNSISVVRDECGECAPNSGNFPWNGQ